MEMRLTVRSCNALAPPKAGRLEVKDADCKGLVLRVTAKGAKSWSLLKWTNGRLNRITLGPFPDLPPEAARRKAAGLLGEIAMNGGIAKKVTNDPTLGAVLERCLEVHWGSTKGKGAKQAWFMRTYTPAWLKKRCSEIDRATVVAMHAKLGATRGHHAANRWHEVVRYLFRVADREFQFPDKNPAIGIKRFKEPERERFLSETELPRFLDAVANCPNRDTQDYLRLLLFTGARKSAILKMKWSDLNLDEGIWTIPAEDAKNGQATRLPLAGEAAAVIQSRTRHAGSPYVFPSNSKTGHLTDPKRTTKAVFQEAGLEGVRVHDLRRTLGSWLAANGASELMIARLLGHANTRATRTYARLSLKSARTSLQSIVGKMAGGGTEESPSETVER
jgi:integrase